MRLIFVVVVTVLVVSAYGQFLRNLIEWGYWAWLPVLAAIPWLIAWRMSTPDERVDFADQCRRLIRLPTR